MPSTFETFRARCLAAGITYEDNVGWYSDRYSCVIYKEMQTINGFEPVPLLAVYTQKIGSEQYNYAGVVSLEYNFVGNESLVDSITRSITDIGSSVLDENPTLNGTLTGMINEIVLRDTNEIPKCKFFKKHKNSKRRTKSFLSWIGRFRFDKDSPFSHCSFFEI